MIYFLLVLDILVNNFTKYTSYFFIIYLYQKPFKYYLLTGLILDFLIFNTMFLNTIILLIMYFFNYIFKDLNKENFGNYILITCFNYLMYIILTNLVMTKNIDYILIQIGLNLTINLIFYILSFRIVRIRQKS